MALKRLEYIDQIIRQLNLLADTVASSNKQNLTNLSTHCEMFFQQLLNILYGFQLQNLNEHAPNYPGLDLGDIDSRVAFQISATKTGTKIVKTLKLITDDDVQRYDDIRILIIGKKQGRYSIDKDLCQKLNFIPSEGILDIDDIVTAIKSKGIPIIERIVELFNSEFHAIDEIKALKGQGVAIQSYADLLETKPNLQPLNAQKVIDYAEKDIFESVKELYDKCSSIPKKARALIIVIAKPNKTFYGRFTIETDLLIESATISGSELQRLINILNKAKLIGYNSDTTDDDTKITTIELMPRVLNTLINWANDNNVDLDRLITDLDFTLTDG
jgi:hypothetical protein